MSRTFFTTTYSIKVAASVFLKYLEDEIRILFQAISANPWDEIAIMCPNVEEKQARSTTRNQYSKMVELETATYMPRSIFSRPCQITIYYQKFNNIFS